MTTQLAYRYEDHLYAASVDEWDNPTGPAEVHVKLYTYPIVRITPKGFWICHYGRNRFILNLARKKYACLSIEDAKISFIARKTRQIAIYDARIATAEEALRKVEGSPI